MTYDEYLTTPHWQEVRKRTLENPYYGRPGQCLICHKTTGLVVHHLTYARREHEEDEDLCILCNSCHHKVHKGKKGKHQTKNIFIKVFQLKYEPVVQLEIARHNKWRQIKSQTPKQNPILPKQDVLVIPDDIIKPKRWGRIIKSSGLPLKLHASMHSFLNVRKKKVQTVNDFIDVYMKSKMLKKQKNYLDMCLQYRDAATTYFKKVLSGN